MSEQQFRGALASGGTFSATARGVEVFGPDGASLAHFDAAVISGVRRDSQIVTLERHNDTIVTLTAASITDAVGLEQFVRDVIVSPVVAAPPVAPPPFEEAPPVAPPDAGLPPEEPPLAFDAFDSEPEAPEPDPFDMEPPPPRPQITSRPEPSPDDDQVPRFDEPLPPPTPTIAPPPSTYAQIEEEPEPIAPLPPPSAPPPPTYATVPQAEGPPQGPVAYAEPVDGDEGGGRRWWLWGCLGCGGLLVATLVCIGILIATEVIDPDDFDDDDDPTPTPFVIVVTPTPEEGADDAATPTQADTPAEPTATLPPAGEDATPTGDGTGDSPTEVPAGDVLQAGESATVAGIEATFNGARAESEGLVPPNEGREYLILSFELTNTTSEPAISSSLLQFELLDESGESFSVALFANIETTVDAEIPPGDTLDGEIAFDIPEGSGPFTVTYSDFLSEESATWAVDDIER